VRCWYRLMESRGQTRWTERIRRAGSSLVLWKTTWVFAFPVAFKIADVELDSAPTANTASPKPRWYHGPLD
jgi:hypothetical protein